MAEVSKINGHSLKDAAAREDIEKIKTGSIPAGDADKLAGHGGSYYLDYTNLMNTPSLLALGETSTTAYAGSKGKANADEIAKIKNGTTKVGKAGQATYVEGDTSKTIAAKFTELNQTIQNVANGVCKGYSFTSVDAMIGDLEGQADNTKYKIGDELYIKAADKPDYWVAEVKTTKGTAVTSVGDGTTVGYWVLYKLGEKTDLTAYQKKTDSTLATTSKTVVGAINEERTTANDAADKWTAAGYYDRSGPGLGTVGLRDVMVEYCLNDDCGQNIANTYIKSLTVSGKTITYTYGNGTIKTLTTQDTVYTLPVSTATVRGGVKVGAVRTTAVTTNAASSTANRYYAVERDSNEKLFVNVPWSDSNTQYQLNVTVEGEEMTIGLATK